MSNPIATFFLSLLCLLLAVWDVLTWRKKKSIWMIISAIGAVLAAMAFWLSWVSGFFLVILSVALLLLSLLLKRKK